MSPCSTGWHLYREEWRENFKEYVVVMGHLTRHGGQCRSHFPGMLSYYSNHCISLRCVAVSWTIGIGAQMSNRDFSNTMENVWHILLHPNISISEYAFCDERQEGSIIPWYLFLIGNETIPDLAQPHLKSFLCPFIVGIDLLHQGVIGPCRHFVVSAVMDGSGWFGNIKHQPR